MKWSAGLEDSTLGKGLLWQRGWRISFFSFFLFFSPSVFVPPPSPITSCSPWQRNEEFAIWHRLGLYPRRASPRGPQQRPGEHAGKCLSIRAISSRPVAGEVATSRRCCFRQRRGGCDEAVRRGGPANICPTSSPGRGDV